MAQTSVSSSAIAWHSWASFAMLGSFQPQSVAVGLRLFFVDRFLDLVELRGRPAAARFDNLAFFPKIR